MPTVMGGVSGRLATAMHAKVSALNIVLHAGEAKVDVKIAVRNDKLVRANQVAQEFGISRVTLWRWERDGLLPRAHRINNQKYFPRTALDDLRTAAEKPGGTRAKGV